MADVALLFARTLDDADASAVIDWKWDRSGELRNEYRRPDTGERARYVQDGPDSLQNLRWNTRVYLGRGWEQRSDAVAITASLNVKFFKEIDPELPPPRARVTRDDKLGEMRRMLARMELGGKK